MFCTKCGSQLEDGAKFCTNCGAQTRFAQVPAPAAQPEAPASPAPAPAAAIPTPQTPAQPAAPAQPAQPTAPQPNAWQQPAPPQQPQQPQWQQPAQQRQPNWQQPQQWQQIQQQWQQQQRQAVQQQQAQQQWQQPPQWQSRQPAPQKKKGKGGLIAGIIAGVLVVAVGVGGFVWPGYLKKGGKDGAAGIGGKSGGAISTALAEKFSTPEEFYQTVETNNVDELAGHISSAYDNIFLSNASADDVSAEGSLRIELGDKARELVLDALGEQLEEVNPGEDLKWLKSIALTYDVSKKDALNGINAAVQLNGTDLAHVKAVIQAEDGSVRLSVPELSDKYLQTTLEELNLDELPISGGALGSMLGGVSSEDVEKLGPVIDALPDKKIVNTILSKYLGEAVDCIENVEKESGTLSTEGVSADYTVLTSTITPDTMVKIIEKIGPELKEDKDIKKAILDVAAAAGEEGEPKYKEFTDKIDELLNDTDSIRENMKHDIVMTVYLDKSGDVHGRVIDSGDQKIELLMPESGGQFGLTIRYTDESGEKLLLNGSGKRSGDKLTGDLDLTVEGEYYAVLALDGFDAEKAKDGYLVGGVELRPTASLWSKLLEKAGKDDEEEALPESVMSVLEALVIRFDLNTAKDKAAVTLTLSNGSDKLIAVSIDGTKSAAKKIDTVDGVDPSEWAGDITLDKLEKVVGNIEKAGVPDVYTDMLDAALDSAFGD